MKYYPINLDIRNKKILIIGGGEIAHQKIITLLEAGGKITVISPHLSTEIAELHQKEKISVIRREYQKGDLKNIFLAFGATNNREVNRLIHEEAKEKGILFNAVDQPDECDFIIPSRISRGDLLITISTAGSAPFLSKAIRKKLESLFGEEYKDFVQLMGNLRTLLTKENRKEELISFFNQNEEDLLSAIKKKDFLRVKKIIENSFGDKISNTLLENR